MKCKFTYECSACGNPCQISGDHVGAPGRCPYNVAKADWHEVTEPAAMPKLTVEALAERGIEWPEWAVCAGVHAFGRLMFFEKRPRLNTSIGGWDYYGFDPIPKMSDTNDFFDYSDWQNSLIMRSDKVEKPDENRFVLDGVEYEAVAVESGHCSCCEISSVCPNVNHPPCANGRRDKRTVYFRKVKQPSDWLKIGEWVAVGKFVGKVDWISRDGSECRITCGESRFAKRDEVKPVTWRAWTRDEWCEQIGKRFKFSDGERMLLGVSDHEAGFMIEFIDRGGAPDEVISEWEITQLNGLPCGVPQVDGVGLEG